MTDQPDVVADHNADQPTDHMSATDRRPTDQEPVSLEAAADQLGITVNAVRQRLKRGTLQGERTAAGWVVFLATNQPTSANRGRSTTDQPTIRSRPATDQPIDQAPLADLIADLARRNEELSAAAALWQERARFLGERLAALESGSVVGETVESTSRTQNLAPQSVVSLGNDVTPVRSVSGSLGLTWRRWWRRVRGV